MLAKYIIYSFINKQERFIRFKTTMAKPELF